jgi:hypothetical protein
MPGWPTLAPPPILGSVAELNAAQSLVAQAAAAPPPVSPAQIAALVLAVGVMGAGARLMVMARRIEPGKVCDPPLPLVGGVRHSTVLTLSLCVLVLGYHIAAWTIPHWLALHVPVHRWWMVVGGILLALGGSALAERAERE